MSKCIRGGVTYKRHVWVDGQCSKCKTWELNNNPECGYCSPFGHEPTCPTTNIEVTVIEPEGK